MRFRRRRKRKGKGTLWQNKRSVTKTVDKMEGQARVRLGATKKQEMSASLNWLRRLIRVARYFD